MVAFALKNFGGMVPRTASRDLPNNMAEVAVNCDLSSGEMQGLPIPELMQNFSALSPQPQRAYRYPAPQPPQGGVSTNPDAWLPLPSPFSSPVRSPLANDTLNRLYWTNPPTSSAPGGHWNTYARILGNGATPAFGTAVPPAPGVTASGGTLTGTGCNPIGRKYGCSWVDASGNEGAISYLSTWTSGAPDGTWALALPSTFPTGAALLRLYRTYTIQAPSPLATLTLYKVADLTLAQILGIGAGDYASWVPTLVQQPGLGNTTVVLEASNGNTVDTTTDAQIINGPQYLGCASGSSPNAGANAPYSMGFIAPPPPSTSAPLPVVTVIGGTTNGSVPEITRSYVFTFVDVYGQESSPSNPTIEVTGPPDGAWVVSGLPQSAPASPSGQNYAPVDHIRLYRTITGATTGAQFYAVADIPFDALTAASQNNDTGMSYVVNYPSGGTQSYSGTASIVMTGLPNNNGNYYDYQPDTTVVNNNPLQSAPWVPPLANLDGLIALPGGMLAGFTGNTVHFCEPDYPHTWPAAYDQSFQYNILALAVWQSSLVVITEGFPFTGSGNSPANFIFNMLRVPEPCISRGSVITDLMGVYYASQNGLVMLNYFGMQNQTLASVTKNIWLNDYKAASIIACRHRAQYLAINGTGTGFIIDYAEQRLGFTNVSPFENVVCVWNDEYDGDTYVIAGGIVYRWDSQNTGPMIYRWRSKQFYLPKPANMAACQISLDPAVETPPPANPPPVPNSDNDPTLVLPAGVNAVFNLYAGPDGTNKVFSKSLYNQREIFALPSGFKAFDWQVEIVSQVGVRSIELASTFKELGGG